MKIGGNGNRDVGKRWELEYGAGLGMGMETSPRKWEGMETIKVIPAHLQSGQSHCRQFVR